MEEVKKTEPLRWRRSLHQLQQLVHQWRMDMSRSVFLILPSVFLVKVRLVKNEFNY